MSEVIAKARVIYEQLQDDELAKSPLSAMGKWIASGAPPSAISLREQGLTSDNLDHAATLGLARKAFVRAWGFSIPCAEAVDAVRERGPVLEVGAGSGYWTALFQNAGIDCVATDIQPAGEIGYGFRPGSRAAVQPLAASQAVLTYPGRTIFCSWPSEGSSWLREALEIALPGTSLALVIDQRPDLTGDASLRRFLSERCEMIEQVQIPNFPGAFDRLEIYRTGYS